MKNYSLVELNALVEGVIIGNTQQTIEAAEQLDRAKDIHISFIGSKKYENQWANSEASIAIVHNNIAIEPGDNRAFIKVSCVDSAMVKLLNLFAPESPVPSREAIHPNAYVDPSAKIGQGVCIGAGCYVGPKSVLGDNVQLFPNVTLLDEVQIGNNTIIWSGAVLRERTKVGHNCIIHSGAVIGADGFGYFPSEIGLVKIPQIGNVVIGNNVEIGANSCIDRGKFSSTIIGNGCKIDNLVQIGHNCILGQFCIMAGNSGLAGSVTLGNFVVIGGSASIKDHVTIGEGAVVGAGSGVTGDIAPGKTVLGYPAVEAKQALRQWATLKNLTKSGTS